MSHVIGLNLNGNTKQGAIMNKKLATIVCIGLVSALPAWAGNIKNRKGTYLLCEKSVVHGNVRS